MGLKCLIVRLALKLRFSEFRLSLMLNERKQFMKYGVQIRIDRYA